MSRLPDADLATLLLYANRTVERLMLERLARAGVAGLRVGHLTLLRVLPHEGAVRLTDLAAAAMVTRQAIAQVVDDLVELGIVQVNRDPRDGRVRMVSYTQYGRKGHIKALDAFVSIERDLLTELGPRRLATLKAGLAATTTFAEASALRGP